MADAAESTPPPARNVVAHQCTFCRCPGADDTDVRRNVISSSEASVGTDTTSFLPVPEVGSNGSVHSGGARQRGSAGFGAQNGTVNVDIDRGFAEPGGVGRGSARRGGVFDDDEDDVDDLFVADIVASNLNELYSGRYPKLKHAFEDWERSLQVSLKRREYKEAQRDAIRNEVYQVIGFYIVFQGVIFTAVAQASALRCHNSWTSFSLSFLTSLVTILAVLQKLSAFSALDVTIASEIVTAKVLKNRISDVKLKVGPARFNFKKHALDGHNEARKKDSSVLLYRWKIMASTEIINRTGKSLKLKVGNNLVFTDLTVVQKDASYKVHVDPNATYQEYLMGKDRNGRPLIISSDDCADNKSITIVEDEEGNFSTIKKARTHHSGPPPPLASPPSQNKGLNKSGSKFWKFINSFRSG